MYSPNIGHCFEYYTERKVCYYTHEIKIHIFVMIQIFGHFNQAQNYGENLLFYKAEYYFNLSIQNTLHNKCKYTRKFSFSAFFKTMANFWRATLETAVSSEPPIGKEHQENIFEKKCYI